MQTVPAVLNSISRRWGYSDYKKVMIGGTLAGFFPARKAVMIRPIEALRAD